MENDFKPKATVCIMDDNDDIREIYGMKFQREGFTTVMAKDGAEGMRLVKENKPDIILLDIQMPVLGGLGVLDALKKDEELAKIPVIILSNVDNDTTFQEVIESGRAQYYLVKSLTDAQKVVDITLEVLANRQQ
jgi:CheY-like chemotaxis protein